MHRVRARLCGAALILALVSLQALSAGAAEAAMQRPFPLITVVGEGSVTATPDTATASAGVTNEAKTPREASDANSRVMNAVIAAARQAGIAEGDIRTSRFSIFPIQPQRPREGAPQVVGYRASNQVQVKVRDVAKLADVLDQLIGAGATTILGIDFSVSDATQRLDEARNAAFAEAKRKAELYARAAGSQVGRAVAITEEAGEANRPSGYRAASAGGAPPAVAPGEETLRAQVSVTFELLQ
jgi:uncharacterized protein YggE